MWGLTAAAAGGNLIATAAAAAVLGGALVGLIFKNAASAWREEREAAVARAERLEATVDEQAAKIVTLERKIDVLEKRTDYDTFAKQSRDDHDRILTSLSELTRGMHANTTAVEFLLRQMFPTAVPPIPE